MDDSGVTLGIFGLTVSKRFQSLFQRRMGHEQLLEANTLCARNPECRQLVRKHGWLVFGLKAFERCNHLLLSSQFCTALIGSELSLATEIHHNNRR